MADFSEVVANVEAQDEVVDIPVRKTDGDFYLAEDGKSPCTIGVLGSESKEYRTALAAAQRKVSKLMLRQQELTEQQREMIELDKVIAVCKRWSGWTNKGESWSFSTENVRAMLKAAPHIRHQVEAGIFAHANFSGASSES